MLIAQEKKKSNISEYILYMWHLEDTFRALQFSEEKVWETLSSKFQTTDVQKTEIHNWYKALMEMLKKENKLQHGHLVYIENILHELNQFHFTLMQEPTQVQYHQAFTNIKPYLINLHTNPEIGIHHPVYLALDYLYSTLLLRIKEQKQLNQELVAKISSFLKELTLRYHQYERGELTFE